jgi:membrane protease YdiL (CAAX protease family)
LLSDTSPYGKILNSGFGARAIILGLIYCFVQASGSEEILFRGLIAKRLYAVLGLPWGNVIQALIFWLMHLALFRAITGEWISMIQLLAFLTSFAMGLVLGYANFRKGGESIAPSWILHGSANFSTFLTLAWLWPD